MGENMKMTDLKISLRLSICFGAVIIFMCLVAGIGVRSLSVVSDATNEIVNDRYVKVALVSQISDKVNTAARSLRNAILARDEQETKKYLDRADVNTAQVTEHLIQMEKLINTPRGMELMKNIKDARAEYGARRQKLREFIFQQKKMEATGFLFAEVIPAQDKYFEALKEMTKFQVSLMDKSVEKSASESSSAAKLMLIFAGIAIALSIICAVIITRSITRPLNDAVVIASAVAAGDLTMDIEATAKDETGQLLKALKSMNESLHKIVSEVRAGTDTINTASGEIASGNLDLSSRTEQQAGSLEETASAMEELTSTVKQNADNARQANTLAESASSVAIQGGSVVSQVVETMGDINDSSKKIVDIISVIDGIAFQTNILALNAAVEAARAGEQGRGFAVVASEVRSLAQRSAAAAKEIKTLIDASVEKVDNGTRLVEQAGTTMNEVVASVKRVTDVVAEISAASHEQSEGIEQINLAITQMDEVTQQNAALVEEAAAAAQSLQEQSNRLSDIVTVFRLSATDMSISPARRSSVDITPRPSALPRKAAARAISRKTATVASADVDGSSWEKF
jgi:methyl-accepting chemotaxis protein